MEKNSILVSKDNLKYNSLDEKQQRNPVSISWHNIQVFGRQKKGLTNLCETESKEKEIIRNVSGEVKSGQLLAIMGSSGAGKTTLLNVLTARNISNYTVKGVIKLNGQWADSTTIRSVSCYVQQNDLFLPYLTVREHLIFQSLLRMDKKLTKNERNDKIHRLMQKFNLTKSRKTSIANISGGEAKRLSFASEVLTNPSIMFCDEPTSGLDSYMAKNIVSVMNRMASEGQTIICTIHQPSSQVFELFKYLLLLADGRTAYMGERVHAINFFSSLGYNCPKDYNPSDYYIDQLAIIPGEEEESRYKLNKICDNYIESNYGLKVVKVNGFGDQFSDSFNEKDVNQFSTGYRTHRLHQFWVLLCRSFISVIRDPEMVKVRLVVTLIMALTMSILYKNGSGQIAVQNINSALFSLMVNISYVFSSTVIGTFCRDLQLVLNENQNHMYGVGVYFVTKIIVEFPLFVFLSILYDTINYYFIGFTRDLNTLLTTYLISILLTNCGISYGYMMSCMCGSTSVAATLSQPFILILIIFSGFFLNNYSLPVWLAWIKYLSWFYYGYEALVVNNWRNVEYIECLLPKHNSTQYSNLCYNNGKEVIKSLYFNENNLNRDLLMLFIISLSFIILAFIALLVRVRKHSK